MMIKICPGWICPKYFSHSKNQGFAHSLVSKESACNAGDLGSSPGSGRSCGERNSSPLQDYI